MREADALEELWGSEASAPSAGQPAEGSRRCASDSSDGAECRNSDDRAGRRGFRPNAGGSWRIPTGRRRPRPDRRGDRPAPRAGRQGPLPAGPGHLADGPLGRCPGASGVAQLDAGTKTIHAAYKDLRRRDRFAADFRPTPYDVWSFRHDRAFGIPHPGSIPPAIVAHALHYYTAPGALVVDPMAGGGTTLDVCQSMGRRCLAYDLHPTRPEIRPHDIRLRLPARGQRLRPHLLRPSLSHHARPPVRPRQRRHRPPVGLDLPSSTTWPATPSPALRPGGYLALLLAPQTEKDLPAGFGYLDHAFFGYTAATAAGFLPERRISCPMDGAYLPQHVRRARAEGRMLGQVRDLLVMRKPSRIQDDDPATSGTDAEITPSISCRSGEHPSELFSRRLPFDMANCHFGRSAENGLAVDSLAGEC